MTISRRDLIKNGLGAMALTFGANEFFNLAAQAANLAPRKPGASKILVVVQLSGGNDGLNMVVPYSLGPYYQLRPTIGIKPEKVLRLNSDVGLHPSMTALHDLYKVGKLAVVQGVGYPNPNRSHFRSIEIWQTGDAEKIAETGWLGRYLDVCCAGKEDLFPAVNVDPMLPKTLFGSKVNVPSVSNIEDFRFLTDPQYKPDRDVQIKAFNDIYDSFHLKRPHMDLLRKAGIDANLASDKLHQLVKKYSSDVTYPQGPFGNNLKFISQMITGGLNCSIYGASLDGFDTHTNQLRSQEGLLKQLSDGLAAFHSDLKKNNLDDDVVVLVFSEFGRRVAENGGRGTDHGTAAPVLVLGSAVRGGVIGSHPSLSDLDNGDLKYKVDFRNVYATILNRWMNCDSKAVLGQRFDELGFLV